MGNNQHPHTRAVHAANDSIMKVIESFKQGPRFMQDSVSPRTQAKRDAIANSPGAQGLAGQGYSQEFLHRVAKLTGTE